jgi:prepilin-type N-terminal cleavage/methylation domain-containing protein
MFRGESMPERAMKILPASSRPTAGFTLLEVLIAFIIAALAISEVMQAVGISLASSRAAAHYQVSCTLASRCRHAWHGARPG